MKWILAFHIIAVIAWFAGLFYLPRLFVYHCQTADSIGSERFKVMEHKLFYYIMTPAMILSWIFGLLLIHKLGFSVFNELWMQIKIILVIFLTFYHFYLGRCLMDFKNDQNTKTSKFFRIINEVPTVLLILIVFIVIFKPI